MSKKMRQKLKRNQQKKGTLPVVQYKDAKGRVRFHGTKHLTATQILAGNSVIECMRMEFSKLNVHAAGN